MSPISAGKRLQRAGMGAQEVKTGRGSGGRRRALLLLPAPVPLLGTLLPRITAVSLSWTGGSSRLTLTHPATGCPRQIRRCPHRIVWIARLGGAAAAWARPTASGGAGFSR
jgi:hypothetical protein